jgi:acetoin utilization deacetylase AcuC-like enzyme
MIRLNKENRANKKMIYFDSYMTCFLYDECMTLHKQLNHLESPQRIESIYEGLKNMGIQQLPSRQATWREVERVHSEQYCKRLQELNGQSLSMEQNDMYLNEHTITAALTAAGSACQLVNEILDPSSDIESGFAIVRPPGHHACRDDCAGFCYINNVMVAAINALTDDPQLHILVVDWDVHYHSGSADIIQAVDYTAQQLTVFSIHRYDHQCFYPSDEMGKTGSYLDDRIINKGFNTSKKNIPGDAEYTSALAEFLTEYDEQHGRPDIIIVSCGFDAAKGDPLGGFKVTPQGYKGMTEQLMDFSGKVALVLEGGYNINVIQKCAIACMESLL